MDYLPVLLHKKQRLGGQKTRQNVISVERRNRDKIEYPEENVFLNYVTKSYLDITELRLKNIFLNDHSVGTEISRNKRRLKRYAHGNDHYLLDKHDDKREQDIRQRSRQRHQHVRGTH